MLIVALLASVFGYLSYYRPATCTVHYKVSTVAVSDLDQLRLKFHAIAGSPYQWTLSNDEAIADLVSLQKGPLPYLYEKSLRVASWPRQADSFTYIQHVPSESFGSKRASGEFAGFWGVRKEGSGWQFRAEAHIAHRQPASATVDSHLSGPLENVRGKLIYEGEMPKKYLVFAAPIGQARYHIVLIEIYHRDDPIQQSDYLVQRLRPR